MNAREGTVLAQPKLDMLAVGSIDPSDTHIQELRRSRFDPKLIKELAASIESVGVLQPILVRRSQANGRADRFEIVAGERRWLASKEAGLKEIPATVRELSDEQVLEVQLIENLQREGLHELEEAEGYEELMKLKKISADAVADMVGRSRSYVFKRTKLLALCPQARTAFYSGKLDASTALLIARIPHEDLQKQAMKELEEAREYNDIQNYQDAANFIRERFMLQLKSAPFSIKDANLVPGAGSCEACPKRTGNQRELFGDVKAADTCTDTKCFEAKKVAHQAAIRAQHEAKGETVIAGADAKKLLPYEHSHIGGGYIDLDAEVYIGDGKYSTPRKALGKALPDSTLLENPHTAQLHHIAKKEDVAKALKAKGVKNPFSMSLGSSGPGDSWRAGRKRAEVKTLARMKILNAIREASAKREFDDADVRLIAEVMLDRTGFDSLKRVADARNLAAGIAKPKGNDYPHKLEDQLPKMSMQEVWMLMLDAALADEIHVHPTYASKAPNLFATAKRLKINPEKIEEQTKAEAAEKKKSKKSKK